MRSRRGERRPQRVEPGRGFRDADRGHDHHKLLAAVAAGHVFPPPEALKQQADGLEHEVAGRVAVVLVVKAEVVEIEDRDRQRRALPEGLADLPAKFHLQVTGG